jgi:hypothetical protein
MVVVQQQDLVEVEVEAGPQQPVAAGAAGLGAQQAAPAEGSRSLNTGMLASV